MSIGDIINCIIFGICFLLLLIFGILVSIKK